MWRLVGRLLSCQLAPFLLAPCRRPGTTNGWPDRPPSNAKLQPQSSPPCRWLPNVGCWRSSSRAPRRERRLAAPLLPHRLWLIALCLLTLPGCWTRRPQPAPAVVKCPAVQCLDRALQACPGVEGPPVRTCADVAVRAVDVGAALLVCQAAQRELIDCIQRHNRELTP